jgi:hypothetical protein
VKTTKRTSKRRTVAQAAREASRQTPPINSTFSCFKTDVLAGKSRRSRKGVWRHNLLITVGNGAVGCYTGAYNWLAAAMGGGPSLAFATITGAATSTSSTSLTNTGASFPASSSGVVGLCGQIVAAYTATPSIVYGVITSNTSTVLTVDQWYNPASTSGASGTTPAGTGQYTILPGQNPAAWLCLSAATLFSPATSDTSLNTQGAELSTNGFSRAVGTYAHTVGASTYTLIHLWTATGTETINDEGVSGAATILGSPNWGGVFPFESQEPSPPTLVSGDTLQNTITVTL